MTHQCQRTLPMWTPSHFDKCTKPLSSSELQNGHGQYLNILYMNYKLIKVNTFLDVPEYTDTTRMEIVDFSNHEFKLYFRVYTGTALHVHSFSVLYNIYILVLYSAQHIPVVLSTVYILNKLSTVGWGGKENATSINKRPHLLQYIQYIKIFIQYTVALYTAQCYSTL